MKDFVYYSPTRVVFGRNALQGLSGLIQKGGYQKVLVHFGGGSVRQNGVLDSVLKQLSEAGAEATLLGGVSPNPKVSLVREGIRICKEKEVDFVLAVGGGSVIDSAKGIALGAKMEQDIWTVFERKTRPEKALPVGSVLTIAAAGSELAGGLVITNAEQGLKRDYGNDCLRPVFAIMNPEFTFTVSPWQTACGIVDILMHTFERYFATASNEPLTDELAQGLCRAVIAAGRNAMEKPEDYEARATLMWASSLSHNDLTGLGRGGDWATHQLEHDLSGMYDAVSHGAGLAVLFPAWCHYVKQTDPDRFCRFARQIWGIDGNGLNREEWAERGIQAAQDYFVSLGMPRTLREFNVEEQKLPEMAEKCSFGGTRTLGGFQTLEQQDMLRIYQLAYRGA